MHFFPSGKQRIHFLILSLAVTTVAIVGFISIYHGYQTYAVVPAVFGFMWAGFLIILWKYCKQSMFQKELTTGVTGVTSMDSNESNNSTDFVETDSSSYRSHTIVDMHTNGITANLAVLQLPPSTYLLPCPTYRTALNVTDPPSTPPSYEMAILGDSNPSINGMIINTHGTEHSSIGYINDRQQSTTNS